MNDFFADLIHSEHFSMAEETADGPITLMMTYDYRKTEKGRRVLLSVTFHFLDGTLIAQEYAKFLMQRNTLPHQWDLITVWEEHLGNPQNLL